MSVERRQLRRLARQRGAVLWALAACLACSEPPAPADPRPLVAVSLLPQSFVVGRIAGARVRVKVLVPPGANPSSYEPAFGELQTLSEAALLVKVGHPGFPFERRWLEALLAENGDVVVVDAFADAPGRADDPHLWLTPPALEAMARAVTPALAALLPGEEAALEANLESFRAELDHLDAELQTILDGVRGREFFVFHPAWGYFADRYGLAQVAIERDHKEPDLRGLADRIEQARRAEAKVIFVQPQFDAQSARVIAAEIGARLEPLDPLAYDVPANLRHVAHTLAAELAP